jgi:hypothetical protein
MEQLQVDEMAWAVVNVLAAELAHNQSALFSLRLSSW